MLKNPELQRNAWTELSTQRLIVMPVVLLLVFILAYTTANRPYEYTYEDYVTGHRSIDLGLQAVYFTAFYAFLALVMVWGAKCASDGVVDEYNHRTWDWQRGHRLNPLEMAVGKLAGPTMYNWYAGIFCLIAMMVSYQHKEGDFGLFPTLLQLIFSAITVHSLSIITALHLIRRADGRGKIRNLFYGVVLFYMFFIQALPTIMGEKDFIVRMFGPHGLTSPLWYFIEYNPWMSVFFTLVWSIWSVLALVQNFRTEYQFANGARVWFWFLGYIIFYYAGFHLDSERTGIDRLCMLLLSGIATFTLIVYFTLLLERKDAIIFKRVSGFWQSRNWADLGRHTPLWLLTLPIVIAGSCLLVFLIWFTGTFDIRIVRLFQLFEAGPYTIIGAVCGSVLFVIRDVCIFIYTNNQLRAARADAAAVLYVILLYSLLPWLATSLTGHNGTWLFLPFGSGAGISWISALVQATFMYMLAASKVREVLD